jgi:hypothetical protein
MSGGENNTASGDRSSISGGGGLDFETSGNQAGGRWASVSGGENNMANEDQTSILGGTGNSANTARCTVTGGTGVAC